MSFCYLAIPFLVANIIGNSGALRRCTQAKIKNSARHLCNRCAMVNRMSSSLPIWQDVVSMFKTSVWSSISRWQTPSRRMSIVSVCSLSFAILANLFLIGLFKIVLSIQVVLVVLVKWVWRLHSLLTMTMRSCESILCYLDIRFLMFFPLCLQVRFETRFALSSFNSVPGIEREGTPCVLLVYSYLYLFSLYPFSFFLVLLFAILRADEP